MYKLCFQGWSQIMRIERGGKAFLRVFKQARGRALSEDMSVLPVKCVA